MLYQNFCKSEYAQKCNGDERLAAAALYIMQTVLEAGLEEDVAFTLVDRAYEVIGSYDEPRFTGIDLAEALLNRHPNQLPDILKFGDEAFAKVAILDAQHCREVWSRDVAYLYDDVEEVIAAELAAMKP